MKPSARAERRTPPPISPLYNGDTMDQQEFHTRYRAYPDDVKFELVGGIVYMASPVKDPHSSHHLDLAALVAIYRAFTPGVGGGDNQTTILGEEEEPQPDLHLRILAEYGGQSDLDTEKYLVGAPELVIEVAYSTRSLDLNNKYRDYLKAGVREYLVYCIEQQEIHWFHFPSKRKGKPDKEGIWKSRVFPGFWVDGPALIGEDHAKLLTTLNRGLASPEHAAFVRKLQNRKAKK